MNQPQFPNHIKQRITDDFLKTFKEKIEETFINELPNKPTYWNYYQWFDSTCGFYKALKTTCELHNFIELYEYLQALEWYDSDILDGELTELLYKRGLIEEGTVEGAYPIPMSHLASS